MMGGGELETRARIALRFSFAFKLHEGNEDFSQNTKKEKRHRIHDRRGHFPLCQHYVALYIKNKTNGSVICKSFDHRPVIRSPLSRHALKLPAAILNNPFESVPISRSKLPRNAYSNHILNMSVQCPLLSESFTVKKLLRCCKHLPEWRCLCAW